MPWFPSTQAVAAAVPQPVVSRFAPSATGYLHAGHLGHLMALWGVTQGLGGRVLFRIEDHDLARARPEYAEAYVRDLLWLGLHPHGLGWPPPPQDPQDDLLVRQLLAQVPTQSQRPQRYQAALDALRQAGHHVYACNITRRQLREANPNLPPGQEARYPNLNRHTNLPQAPGHSLRLHLPDDAVAFNDLLLGPQTQTPQAQCGDLMLRDAHGQWTYHFANVVDDLDEGVTLVVRGQDLLHATGRQLLLAGLLGRQTPPAYLHHALLTDAQGRKLSKRQHDESLTAMRLAGANPQALMGQVAHQLGWQPSPKPIPPHALPGLVFGDCT